MYSTCIYAEYTGANAGPNNNRPVYLVRAVQLLGYCLCRKVGWGGVEAGSILPSAHIMFIVIHLLGIYVWNIAQSEWMRRTIDIYDCEVKVK